MFLSKVLKAANHPYITQKGGRLDNNHTPMAGLTWKSLKHHKALQPLFLIVGGGMVFVAAYCFRLAAFTTDVNWVKNKKVEDTYGYYEAKQFKFLNPAGVDYSKYAEARPKYQE
eukprot:TRINITY_DN747_c0_g1_i1.p2 TRINITY_DN747_c0_g1~~TRINITY_DN747_c0_g1_i1.p2  ORF type:complete len:114 (-),score=42.09 TRINITY_DN747_c0_g1_i1:219-560(-)